MPTDLFAGSDGGPDQPGTGTPSILFDGSDSTWGTILGNTASVPWQTPAVVTIGSVRIRWAYGGLFPGGGAAGPFRLETGPTSAGPWSTFLEDPDPVGTAGASYPGDFEHTYALGANTAGEWFRWVSPTIANNDVFTVEAYGAVAPPPPDPPYVPAPPARALLELYLADPAADRWGSALWGSGVWSTAAWQDATPQGVVADVSFGADSADSGILADVAADVWAVRTYDPERKLDPSNADSPFYPAIVPGLPIRLSTNGRVIRTGIVQTAEHSLAEGQGDIRATSVIAPMSASSVPEDTELPDTLRARARDAIAAAGLAIAVEGDPPGGDPELAPWEPGTFSVWDVIRESAREVLCHAYVDRNGIVRFRAWRKPLDRGIALEAPYLVDVRPRVSDRGMYSAVVVNDATAMIEVERRLTPTPRYGLRTHRRTLATIDGGDWADAVLEDRSAAGLQYAPGRIRPDTAQTVERFTKLEHLELVSIEVPDADPPVYALARILGVRIRVTDRGTVGPDWEVYVKAATAGTEPLIADGVEPAEYLVDDDTGEYLYPDGVVVIA